MVKSKFIFIAILCLAFLGFVNTSHATTPTISNVSGSVATGQTITVSGANMVNEDHTNWGSFFSTHPNASGFEGSTYLADGYTLVNPAITCDGTLATRCWRPVYDTGIKLMGNKSIKFHVESIDNDTSKSVTSYTAIGGHGVPVPGDVWVRFYARWDSTTGIFAQSHMKMIDSYGDKQQYLQVAPNLQGFVLKDNAATAWINPAPADFVTCQARSYVVSHSIELGRWYLIEGEFKSTAPYTLDLWVDGVRKFNSTSCGPTNAANFMIGIINTQMSLTNGEVDHYWDSFGVSSARIYGSSTIEISNNPTYGSGAKVYQEPVYLSDGSVQIKADLTGLGSGPYYLWVTNNRQERSAVYNLSGAGGGDTTPPAAPSGLSVS